MHPAAYRKVQCDCKYTTFIANDMVYYIFFAFCQYT